MDQDSRSRSSRAGQAGELAPTVGISALAASAWLRASTADNRRIEARRRAESDPNRRLPGPRR